MPDPPAGGAPAGHAGALIRAARLSRGWSVSHLAMLHKLTERRLEALEEGRFTDVGDATFVRALVRSLCRHLGVDPQPVLDALPPSLHSTTPPMPLPVRAEVRPTDATRIPAGKGDVIGAGSWVPRPVLIGVGAILACALLLALLPYLESLSPVARAPEAAASGGVVEAAAPAASGSLPENTPAAAGTPAAAESQANAASGAAAAAAVQPGASAPAGGGVAASPSPGPTGRAAPDAPAPPLIIQATQATWIGVRDAQGQTLLSRIVAAGETVALEGARPLSVRVGNVAGTQIQWKGVAVDLQGLQRNNVATFDLQ